MRGSYLTGIGRACGSGGGWEYREEDSWSLAGAGADFERCETPEFRQQTGILIRILAGLGAMAIYGPALRSAAERAVAQALAASRW